MDLAYTKIVIAGHVDHGKSTLVGRLLNDTNQIFPERVAKVKNICEKSGKRFEFAFLLDAFEEEQSQGITIDKTEIPWVYQGKEFLIIDTPGHKEFLKNMISGASTAEIALIMLDAHEGVKDQFKRHSYIIGMLGIKSIIVVINKMDLINYDQSHFLKLETEAKKIFTELRIKAPQIIPVSAFMGENLIKKSEQMPWYKGPTLADALLKVSTKTKDQKSDLRFSLQDIYKFDDKRVYAGKVESGELNVGDEIKFFPSGSVSKIKSIESWNTPTMPTKAEIGSAVGITLHDPLFLERGEIATLKNQTPPSVTYQTHASIFWMGHKPLIKGKNYKFKMLTQEVDCKIESIFKVFNPQTFDQTSLNSNEESTHLENGEAAEIIIKFQKNIVCDSFSNFESTGRFVLIDDHRIVGGGVIINPNTIYVFKETSELTKHERANHYGHLGAVLWLTGLSGAGKSTIAKILEKRLFEMNAHSIILDGDNLRKGICRDLGFSIEDRHENIRRTGEVAKLIAESGIMAIAALISPLKNDREMVRGLMTDVDFIEIFVSCSLEECERRDKKGLYKKARAGEIKGFTGIDSKYEAPTKAEIVIDSHQLSPNESVEKIIQYLIDRKILFPNKSL